MDETYRWDDDSYTAVAKAHVAWQDATHVLRHAHPRIRQHIGSVLRIAAPDRAGNWLVVALIEEGDDAYLVTGARYPGPDEVKALIAMTKGGQ